VEDMLATKLYHSLLTKSLHIANRAIWISIVAKCHWFIFSYTVLMQAWRMDSLSAIAPARMPTLQEFWTRLPGLPFAFRFSTNSLLLIFKHRSTEPALLGMLFFLILLAIFSHMIRFSLARYAEVVAAVRASHSVCTHVFSRKLVNIFTIIILVVIDYLSLYHFDSVATFASYYSLIFLEQLICHLCLQCFIALSSKYWSNLIVSNLPFALLFRALYIRIALFDGFFEAF
jgi:hypothetical protein